MAALTANYEGLSVWLYDTNGKNLSSTTIETHDRVDNQITVMNMPHKLKQNDVCRILILTTPAPCEYQGKIKKISGKLLIALFQGMEKEEREATRFSVTTPATIDSLICEEQSYPLYIPVQVTLVNVSTSGVRFRAPYFSLSDGDKIHLNMSISNGKKRLVAEVVNHLDKEGEYSDYGCRFIGS